MNYSRGGVFAGNSDVISINNVIMCELLFFIRFRQPKDCKEGLPGLPNPIQTFHSSADRLQKPSADLPIVFANVFLQVFSCRLLLSLLHCCDDNWVDVVAESQLQKNVSLTVSLSETDNRLTENRIPVLFFVCRCRGQTHGQTDFWATLEL